MEPELYVCGTLLVFKDGSHEILKVAEGTKDDCKTVFAMMDTIVAGSSLDVVEAKVIVVTKKEWMSKTSEA